MVCLGKYCSIIPYSFFATRLPYSFQDTLFLLPSILFTTVGVCYLGFNGEMTPLLTFSDVFACWRYTDVMLRVILFFFSIITPIFFVFIPYFAGRFIDR